ncbi:MAG: IS21 family transposase [Alphaproteobacteria bacterium]|nr:IS21 family transposase [Alphaproteobacteria bacterium]
MLDRDTRAAILRLHEVGVGQKRIARELGVSRNAVRRVVRDGRAHVPGLQRAARAEPHLERIRELHARCKGNLVRVHEELCAEGVEVAYPTLTAFCRRQGIGVTPKRPSGRYHFVPGEEMQHDTSPHRVKVGGRERRLQCASLILAHSRMLYARVYPCFDRFTCRIFLTEALQRLGGAAQRCIVDNSSVIVAHGTGPNAVFAPEMNALADRFSFTFDATHLADPNRKGRVERPFHYIENNFYAGRTFADLDDLNRQLDIWCGKSNARYRDRLQASPLTLYQAERPAMRPLPLHVPEVYACHSRVVDVEGYVTLHLNRYSVDAAHIGRRVEVREYAERVELGLGHKPLATHPRHERGARRRSLLPRHRGQRRDPRSRGPRTWPEEAPLRVSGEALAALVDRLKEHHGGHAGRHLRRLHRMFLDYPTQPLDDAVAEALRYGLIDLTRIERMVLRRLAGAFFRLPTPPRPGGPVTDEIDQLLRNLKLRRIPDVLPRELERAEKEGVSYQELLVRLLRIEHHAQQTRSMEYRIKRARLPERWSLETFPFDLQPGVRAPQLRQLAELDFISRAENLVFIGPTGVGKTGLASAILLKALESGFRGLFIKAQDLFDEMYTSLADRSTRRLLNRLARIDVLLIDEMGYLNLHPEQTNIFFKLMEERYRRKPTLLTTNLEYEDWYEFLGQKEMVAALLDRMRHRCTTIRIDGESLRTPEA